MSFIRIIVFWLEIARDWLYDAYVEVSGWIFPFFYLATPFWWLYNVFKWLAEKFVEFDEWLVWAWDRIKEILSEIDIWNILSTPIRWAETAWNWIVNSVSNIWTIITDWWGVVSSTVLGWIDTARDWLLDRIDDVKALADKTWSNLTNFFTVTLPQLVGWGELDSIIISTLRTWFPMYNNFCYFWDSIEEFFADPLEWIYNKLEEFFERFW